MLPALMSLIVSFTSGSNPTSNFYHFQEKHKKDSRLKCKHCGHHYLRKDNLDAHIRSAHVAQTGSDVITHVAKCQLCDKTYGNENNLSDHMRTCHGILPWNVLPKKNGEELDMDRLKLELAGSVKVPTQSCFRHFTLENVVLVFSLSLLSQNAITGF